MHTKSDSEGRIGRDCRRCREQLFSSGLAGARGAASQAATVATAVPPALPAIPESCRLHLDSCRECSRLADRLALVHDALSRPLSTAQPRPGFSTRVVARIGRPEDLLGWAAFRALPAALGLALALACFGLASPAAAPAAVSTTAQSVSPLLLDEPPSSDQLLAWSAQPPEVWP